MNQERFPIENLNQSDKENLVRLQIADRLLREYLEKNSENSEGFWFRIANQNPQEGVDFVDIMFKPHIGFTFNGQPVKITKVWTEIIRSGNSVNEFLKRSSPLNVSLPLNANPEQQLVNTLAKIAGSQISQEEIDKLVSSI